MDDDGVLRLVGPAVAVAELRVEFQKLERSPSGSAAHVNGWTLRVEDDLLMPEHEREIVLPWHAWGIAACVLSDVAYGYEPNPLDFSTTGYLTVEDAETGQQLPWPRPDIGVVVEGEFAEDAKMRRRQASADEFQRVIGCVEGESWSDFISEEATMYDGWFDDDPR